MSRQEMPWSGKLVYYVLDKPENHRLRQGGGVGTRHALRFADPPAATAAAAAPKIPTGGGEESPALGRPVGPT